MIIVPTENDDPSGKATNRFLRVSRCKVDPAATDASRPPPPNIRSTAISAGSTIGGSSATSTTPFIIVHKINETKLTAPKTPQYQPQPNAFDFIVVRLFVAFAFLGARVSFNSVVLLSEYAQ